MSNINPQYMVTELGYENIKKEIEDLSIKLKNGIENEVEFSIYKNKLTHLESVFGKLIICPKKDPKIKHVCFGDTVYLESLDTKEEKVFQIVGTEEADISNGKISNLTPFAKELFGKEVDDDISDIKGQEFIITKII